MQHYMRKWPLDSETSFIVPLRTKSIFFDPSPVPQKSVADDLPPTEQLTISPPVLLW